MSCKIRRFAVILLGVALCSTTTYAKEPEAVPGEYVVKMKPAKAQLQLSEVASILGTQVKERISKDLYVIRRGMVETRDSVIASLEQLEEVEIVEPNFIYRINATPNDPKLGELWGLHNVGQKSGVAGVDIGAVEAWDISTGSKEVVVAVIDTGVDPTIRDLKDNMWVNEAELNGQRGVDDDGNGYVDDIHGYDFVNKDGDPTDDHGHGSHVSGTIGGSGDDGYGLVGVNWKVSIMGVKFLSAGGSGSLEDAIKAIDYARQMGAHILSNSWGGGGYSDILKQAIQRTHDEGRLFVAAAGNDGTDNDRSPTYPASYEVPNVLAVAAVDNRGDIASFSNYGKTKVHVGAPGVDVFSSTPNGYTSWSGTSMACPHVSGIAALLLANEPTLTSLEIKERIIASASPLRSLKSKSVSGGMANAYYALTNTKAPRDPNDPEGWKSMPYTVATAHPYPHSTTKEWRIELGEEVTKISVHFSRFETERGYDKAEILDANGRSAGVLSGNHNDEFSPHVEGNVLVIKFTSDDSVNGFGFEIDKLAFE